MSPLHLQYLRNMGVTATLVVSLVREGRLWGLIACHHYAPRHVSHSLRAACGLLAEVISTRISAVENYAQAQGVILVRALEQRLIDAASRVSDHVTFDVGHPSLLPAGDMPSRIHALAPGLRDADQATVIRSILESLALAYAQTLEELQRLTGVSIETVHIVGGASQNALLCRLIADRSGRDVVAGPVEATAIGNIIVQARAAGLVTGTLEDLRALVARATAPQRSLAEKSDL
jgi:sugar (pentulose or hexulose) kinase